MPDYSEAAKLVADQLPDGDRSLDNAALRELFGVSRMTAKARGEIAEALRAEGLEMLSDPAREPLVLRRRALVGGSTAVRLKRAGRPWYRLKRTWALAAVVLLVLVSALSGDPQDDSARTSADAATTTSQQGPRSTTATPAEPRATFEDAVAAADDDHYSRAVAIASGLGEDDSDRIRRKISRRIAARATYAVKRGNRTRARRLLSSASDYPRTAQVTAARASLSAADERAAARKRARERAEAQRQAAAKAARAERRRERAAARAAERAAQQAKADAAPDDSGSSSDGCDPNYSGACVPDTGADVNCPEVPGPVTVVGDDVDGLDRDNDGIGCDDN